ncbi:T9SS type A sorting domain-containing protein [Algibacter lectus]|uniref:Putative secreted protein (Por secretion system target) n=1 Tax=Algibacter lectus TaxID=221126 RepID=A0A4R8MC58_9FLAO|nr:T9SS type A sorting domain-containing protein [Algibacter lectus]MWW25392.1 T9SS type A sorting domain-containing protein [Algibacter lectus]TDY61336.1 putative secreted protein (Por secretion system target) [Algibacter lectus]
MGKIYTITLILFFSFLNSNAQTKTVEQETEHATSALLKSKDVDKEDYTAAKPPNLNEVALSTENNVTAKRDINISPNPSSHFIQISGLKNTEQYRIYNILGKQIAKGLVSNNATINIENLKKGLYLLKINNANSRKFLKE